MGKLLVKVDFIGLVNILAGQEVVEELIQCDAEPGHLEPSLSRMMTSAEKRKSLSSKLLSTAARLGDPGSHQRAATEVLRVTQGERQSP